MNPTPPVPAPTTGRPPVHWAVRMNHVNRSWGFAALMLAVGVHLWGTGAPPLAWAALTGFFVLYPQLAWWRGQRAAQPLRAEVQHMLLDMLGFGAVAGGLGFPPWLAFTFLLAGLVNLGAFRGYRGSAWGLGAFVAGALPAFWGLAEGRLQPDAHARSAAVAALCLAVYMVVTARDAWRRSVQLHQTREALRRKEQSVQQQLAENLALQAQLRDLALRDPLTGLHNRRALEPALARELERCRREGQPLTLMLLDVDHFKRINDLHGHAAGDAVLRTLGQHLAAAVRGSDLACRWGGEEFLLMLPGLDPQTAQARAEACRRLLEEVPRPPDGPPTPPTMSLGVAHYPIDGESPEALLRAADAALYAAKAGGRNRVVSAARLARSIP